MAERKTVLPRCPHCGHPHASVSATEAGIQIRCSNCKELYSVQYKHGKIIYK